MQTLPFYFTVEEIIDEGRTTLENIQTIKTWLSTLEDRIVPTIQDEMIVIFLLSCENNISLTKNTIIMHYKCKADSPEIFDDRDMEMEDMKRAMNTINLASIPVRTDEGYAVHYFRLNDTAYSHFDLVPIMKLSYMLLDITQEKKLPKGLVVVIDVKGVSLMHLTRLKVGALKKYLHFLQEGFPLQMKVIHIVNAVYFMDKIMNLVKVFMKSELIDMIKIHQPYEDHEKLFSFVPKKCWPEEYGGDLPHSSVLHGKTMEQFLGKQEFWRIEQEIRCQCRQNSL